MIKLETDEEFETYYTSDGVCVTTGYDIETYNIFLQNCKPESIECFLSIALLIQECFLEIRKNL